MKTSIVRENVLLLERKKAKVILAKWLMLKNYDIKYPTKPCCRIKDVNWTKIEQNGWIFFLFLKNMKRNSEKYSVLP